MEDTIKSLAVGQRCSGRLVRRIQGGFLVNIGVNALLPEDCAAPELQCNPDALLARIIFRVNSMDNERRTVCVVLEDAISHEPHNQAVTEPPIASSLASTSNAATGYCDRSFLDLLLRVSKMVSMNCTVATVFSVRLQRRFPRSEYEWADIPSHAAIG